MSGRLAGKVWHSNLPGHLKPLAACLADEADDHGHGIYPSIAYLAWKLSKDSRSVQRGMAELRARGLIRQVEKKKFGRIFVPVYFLDPARLPYRRPWTEVRRGDTSVTSSVSGDTHDTTSNPSRGDTSVTLPVSDPLVRKNLGRSAASSTSPPVEKRKATPQQKRYATVKRLAEKAGGIVWDLPNITDGDLAEQLKQWAAENDIPYFDAWPGSNSPIEQAIIIARQRAHSRVNPCD